MSEKSNLKDIADKMIDNESKQKNSTITKNSNVEDIKISKLKENLPIIFCFVLLFCMGFFSFAMANFAEGNVMGGLFLIWLIPFIIFITILLCLKYANLKFYDHVKFLTDKMNKKINIINKKLGKVIHSDIFFVIVFLIFSLAFLIFCCCI